MNDETTKELEDLSTLACSTDEVARKRALVAMLGRVVGRASQVDHEWESPADVDDADRYALEANLREVTQQRDRAQREMHDYGALIRRAWGAVPGDVTAHTQPMELVEAIEELAVGRAAHRVNAETLARDLAEARAEVERLRSLAGSSDGKGRMLTAQEFDGMAAKSRQVFNDFDGTIPDSHRAMLRWLEREGYLSVRLPPEE